MRVSRFLVVWVWLAAAPVSAQDQQQPPPPPPPPPPAQPQTQPQAQLTIQTSPPTRVSIDGRVVGVTPVTISVAPGGHEVLLERVDGSFRETVSVMLAPGEQMQMMRTVGPALALGTQLSFSFGVGGQPGLRIPHGLRLAPQLNPPPPPGAQGAFVVITTNRPATISVDGRPIGRTPRRFFLSAGRHRVDVVSSTGQRRKVMLTVRHGQNIRRQIRF